MKKFLFVFMALVATSITVFASKVYIAFTNGNGLEGVLIHHNDTSLLIRTDYELDQNQEILIKPSRVKYFTISNVGRYEVEDGKFVPTAKAQAKLIRRENKLAKIEERKRILNAANPNEVIAKAFKTTGDICIIAGIPATVAGAILLGIGYKKDDTKTSPNHENMPQEDANVEKSKKRANCGTAGCILLPFGAALTLVGFPLHIHGKRIGEIKVNYTGNGAGITMNF